MNIQLVKKIYEEKIDITTFIILCMIRDGEDIKALNGIRKIEGGINVMKRKGWVDEQFNIKPIGKGILKKIEENIIEIPQAPKKAVEVFNEIMEKNAPFDDWTEELLKKLKTKLKSIIGKDQIMGFGNVY